MAVSGSGLGAGPDTGEFTDQTKFDARNGAPKKAQTSFAVKDGMKDQNAPSGVTSAIAPIHPGAGPDASAADVMDPESSAERGKSTPSALKASWGMKGGMGQDVDTEIGGKVLGEAILSGSTKLPASTTENSGPAPAYSGNDSN